MNEHMEIDTPKKIIADNIQLWYNRGQKFFTKDGLRLLAKQLDKHKEQVLTGSVLHQTTIRGDNIQTILDIDEGIWKDLRCRHGERRDGLSIYYRPLHMMLSQRDMKFFDLQKAYLSTVIMRPHSHHHHPHHKPALLPPNFSPTELTHLFTSTQQRWETSEQHGYLKKLLTLHRRRLASVTKIVAFACGPLAEGDEASLTQHALVLSLQRIIGAIKEEGVESESESDDAEEEETMGLTQVLGEFWRVLRGEEREKGKGKGKGKEREEVKNEEEVRCFAQDPAYRPLDQEVLDGAGITVLEDPRAFLEVDDNAFVVSISPNAPVQQIVADLASPAAIIQLRTGAGADPVSPRVEEMLSGYMRLELIYHKGLGDVLLYIRREKPRREGTK
ncbi:uncharacterized protein GGS25DRAFT_533266 [Hypoxylon fragiforme]|uniref:uncharacterized protein n=1 Tax=Hypoxylon fragiforme TaxID=63214 RepID=UPI0020C687F0|nr:uncharacterized protein GGS25DRAFT_533266 [Hypoxylon fragiforme]KAI2606141.1 hypothetical protein GGS25DRAFT_533266 [Hypoxylon fragiforme]